MIPIPMKRARKHSEIHLTKNDREALETHFQECSSVVKKQEIILRQNKMKKVKVLSESDMIVLRKVIANTSFYELLIQKFGENFAKSSLKYLRFDAFQEGDYILREGELSMKTFYILKGQIRNWKGGKEYSEEAGEVPGEWKDALSGSQRYLTLGTSFGYLPKEIFKIETSFQANSLLVEVAYIDQFGIGFITKDVEDLATLEKLDFFSQKMPLVFEGIAKQAALIFVKIIQEKFLKLGESVSLRFPKGSRRICVLSKGILTKEKEVQIEIEKLQLEGIELSDVRELKRRTFCSKILKKGDVFLANSMDSDMNESTHLRVTDTLISSAKDSRIYFYTGEEYEEILDDLRYQMRYDAFLNTDNLKTSAKLFEDFIKIRHRFLFQMESYLPPHQRDPNPAPPPLTTLKNLHGGSSRMFGSKSSMMQSSTQIGISQSATSVGISQSQTIYSPIASTQNNESTFQVQSVHTHNSSTTNKGLFSTSSSVQFGKDYVKSSSKDKQQGNRRHLSSISTVASTSKIKPAKQGSWIDASDGFLVSSSFWTKPKK